MLEWEDKWGQNGRGMVVAKRKRSDAAAHCVWSWRVYTFVWYMFVRLCLYLLIVAKYIFFVRFLLLACSNGNLTGATLNGHIWSRQPKMLTKCWRNAEMLTEILSRLMRSWIRFAMRWITTTYCMYLVPVPQPRRTCTSYRYLVTKHRLRNHKRTDNPKTHIL